MRRINQLWPDGLYERVEDLAGRRAVTDYTVAALELALASETHPSQQRPQVEVASLAEEPPPAPQTFRCPRECDPSWRPESPMVRCPSCRRQVVPA